MFIYFYLTIRGEVLVRIITARATTDIGVIHFFGLDFHKLGKNSSGTGLIGHTVYNIIILIESFHVLLKFLFRFSKLLDVRLTLSQDFT